MHAMAEFMRQRHHIARLALKIDQHIRMRRRHGRMRKRARRLAGSHRRVNPATREEIAGDLGHAWRETGVGAENNVARLIPGIGLARRRRQGRAAIPIIEFVFAEPFRLEAIIAMRQARVRRFNRLLQRFDHFAFDAIGEMARIRDIAEATPAIGDLLILGERVGDQREGAQIGFQRDADRLRRFASLVLVAILHLVQRWLDRQFGVADAKPQPGDGFIKQPIPGGGAGDVFFVKKFFELVIKFVRLLFANILQPGAPARQRRLTGESFESVVVEAIEFELKEQQLRRGDGDLLLHVAIKFRMRRIGRIGAVEQAGIGHQSSQKILQRLVTGDRLAERRRAIGAGGESRQSSAIGFGKGGDIARNPLKIGFHLRRVRPRIKIGEVPFRQRSAGGGCRGLGGSGGNGRGEAHGKHPVLVGGGARNGAPVAKLADCYYGPSPGGIKPPSAFGA